jgi:hypothetical protein
MTTTGLGCAACGIELPPNSKLCNGSGAAVSAASKPAEYKQVTLLSAEVVIPLGATSWPVSRTNFGHGRPPGTSGKFPRG